MAEKPNRKLHESAVALTRWVGSLQSIAIHTLVFVASFLLVALNVLPFDRMLLVLTTVFSIEAIYLALFIQLTVNAQAQTIEEIQEDVDEIQEDVEEIQEDVDELQEDVEEMTEEEKEDASHKVHQKATLEQIHASLQKLMSDLEKLQKQP